MFVIIHSGKGDSDTIVVITTLKICTNEDGLPLDLEWGLALVAWPA